MHILMVLDLNFPTDTRVENEALSLIEAGFSVSVLTIAPDTRPPVETYRGITIYRAGISRTVRDKMRGLAGTVPLYSWYLRNKILSLYKQVRFDVLHMHDLYMVEGGLWAKEKLNIPVVADLHENYVHALKHYAWSSRFPARYLISIPRWERLEKKWVNQADRVIVVIEEAAERNRKLGVPAGNLTVVPNTINLPAFESYPVDPVIPERYKKHYVLVYTGVFDVHRGLASVLEGLPRIIKAKPETKLLLIGDGRIRPELEARVRDMDLSAHVSFEGWQPQERLKGYIAAADICLIPHLKTEHTDATIPHKLFHYMYMEKPVLASNCEPLKRIIEQEDAGLIYPAGDSDAFAAAVLEMAGSPDTYRQKGIKGAQAVHTSYNWEATSKNLIGMYRQLL
ncbi:MAG: glycosyltransferase family 4 protein [Balneolales bacterium]